MGHGSATEHHEGELGHIIPLKVYQTVLGILLVLTVITVAVSRIDFGSMNLVVAMIIASIKAGIVALYFMHLKYENPVLWVYVAFPLVLLVIMIAGIFIDNPYRNDPHIYHEAPAKVQNEKVHNDSGEAHH